VTTIDHFPNAISVRAALSESALDRSATIHVVSKDAATNASIAKTIETTPRSADLIRADLRYAIVYTDRSGKVERIYLDRFGLRGSVNGHPVRFANDAIKRALVKAFPNLAE
jgi:hypothetical protein